MNLDKLLQLAVFLIPVIGNCTDKPYDQLVDQETIPKLNLTTDNNQPELICPISRQSDYDNTYLSQREINAITMSTQFRTIDDDNDAVIERSQYDHAFYFGHFGLIKSDTCNNKSIAPLLTIFTQNNKVKIVKSHIDKAIFDELLQENRSTMLKHFISYHKLPSTYQKIVENMPKLQKLFEQNVYYASLGYYNLLKTIFDNLDLHPHTQYTDINPIDTLKSEQFAIHPVIAEIQKAITLAQNYQQRYLSCIDKFQKLLPDIALCNSVYQILKTDKETDLLIRKINREYPWTEHLEKINNPEQYQHNLSILFNVQNDIAGTTYFKGSAEQIRHIQLQLINSNDDKAARSDDTFKNYEHNVHLIIILLEDIKKQFGNL